MDDRKSIIDRITGATEDTVARVQQEMSQSTVVNATKERATAMRQRAQQAAMSQLQVATREDVARLQASLDRVEAALNDLAKRLPESKPRPRRGLRSRRRRATRLAATRARAAEARPGTTSNVMGVRPGVSPSASIGSGRSGSTVTRRARLMSAFGWPTCVPR